MAVIQSKYIALMKIQARCALIKGLKVGFTDLSFDSISVIG
jgi:hypothetical protein